MAGITQKLGSAMEMIFGARPVQAPVQPTTNNLQTNPVPQGTQQTQQTDANGVIPVQKDEPAKSPLEIHKDLWETAPVDKNAPTPTSPEEVHAKMLEAAGKVDFSRVINPEDLAKITAGGEEATQALVRVLNKTVQTAYGQSTVVAKKLVDQAVEQAEARFQSQVPTLVKRQNAQESLFAENPAFSNPVVAPIITALQTQLAEKHPKATAAELNKLAKELLVESAGIFNPPKTPAKSPKEAAETGQDWDDWLKM